jgi:hypothetical protein
MNKFYLKLLIFYFIFSNNHKEAKDRVIYLDKIFKERYIFRKFIKTLELKPELNCGSLIKRNDYSRSLVTFNRLTVVPTFKLPNIKDF